METKATGDEIKADKVEEVKVPTETKIVKKKAARKPKKKVVKVPEYLNNKVTDFVVGTEDYRNLVEEHNKVFSTEWNPWRVRPAVFYGLWEGLRKHYKL